MQFDNPKAVIKVSKQMYRYPVCVRACHIQMCNKDNSNGNYE